MGLASLAFFAVQAFQPVEPAKRMVAGRVTALQFFESLIQSIGDVLAVHCHYLIINKAF
jgi:hypothetical protein